MATLVAGELYYELDGQLLEIKRQLRQPSGYPFDLNQLKVALQNAIEGKFESAKPEVVPKKKPVPLCSVIAMTTLGAIAGKPTKKCFVDGIWNPNWRDGDIDRWLQKNHPESGSGVVSTVGFSESWTFLEAVRKLPGVDAEETDPVKVGNRLIELGYTITCPQAQEMAEKTECGENTGMRTDGYGNFYLVETGDPKNPVSVGYVSCAERAWDAYVYRLDDGLRWHAAHRLLVRNLDASKPRT